MTLVADPVTQRSACTALDALLEILHDVIEQYLHLIMERLSGLLETAPVSVKAVVTGAIGSAAHASKEKFLPYFSPTMDRLQHFLVLTGEGEETELRGITMDAVGTFAEAVGKDVFRPYFNDMMKQAFQGIEMGSSRLRECSFLFFGVMARVFGEEFAPSLAAVVPPLLASCKQEESGQESGSRECQISSCRYTLSEARFQWTVWTHLPLHPAHRLLMPSLSSMGRTRTSMGRSKSRISTLTRCSMSIARSPLRRRSLLIPSVPCLLQRRPASCHTLNSAPSSWSVYYLITTRGSGSLRPTRSWRSSAPSTS